MSQFATAAELRTFLDTDKSDGRYSTTNLDFLLTTASEFLERATGRVITASASNTTRTFSTNAQAYVVIPDLRALHSNSPVSLQDTALEQDTSFWLIPSRQNPSIYTGIQLRAFGQGRWDYRSNPQWFDRNLDHWLYPGNWGDHRLPNDLTVTGLWGWDSPPAGWKHATLILAGWYVKRPDSQLANSQITPEGNFLSFGELPPEIVAHLEAWRLGEQVQIT